MAREQALTAPAQSCQGQGSALGERSGITAPKKSHLGLVVAARGRQNWGHEAVLRGQPLSTSSQTRFQLLLCCEMLPGCRKRGCTHRPPGLPDALWKRKSPAFEGKQRAKAPLFHWRGSERRGKDLPVATEPGGGRERPFSIPCSPPNRVRNAHRST